MADEATEILKRRGFDRIAQDFPAEATKALEAARSMTARRPAEADATVEPAHIYKPIGAPR